MPLSASRPGNSSPGRGGQGTRAEGVLVFLLCGASSGHAVAGSPWTPPPLPPGLLRPALCPGAVHGTGFPFPRSDGPQAGAQGLSTADVTQCRSPCNLCSCSQGQSEGERTETHSQRVAQRGQGTECAPAPPLRSLFFLSLLTAGPAAPRTLPVVSTWVALEGAHLPGVRPVFIQQPGAKEDRSRARPRCHMPAPRSPPPPSRRRSDTRPSV